MKSRPHDLASMRCRPWTRFDHSAGMHLANLLLNPASTADELAAACAALYERWRNATPAARLAAEVRDNDLRLDSGVALSPRLAAQCLLDAPRTAAFLRGTLAAIGEAMRRFPEEPIEVVYAGTGPFATLALPLFDRLEARRVRFTLIDIDERSTESVRSLVEHFGLGDYVKAIIRADATKYRHDAPVHVVVTETMQRALSREPFVAIVRNLGPQLVEGGLLVPEGVTLDLMLLDAKGEQARWNGESAEHPAEHVATIDTDRETLVTMPRALEKWPALFTTIDVFADETLLPYVSGLTAPAILWELVPITHELRLAFHYETGAEPRVGWRAR
jgi:hypothetical protein